MGQEAGARAAKPKGSAEIALTWGSADDLDLLFADNLHLAQVNELFYLTFGQTRVPVVAKGTAPTEAEIRPVSRLVISRDAFNKIATLLGRYAEGQEG
jgi:hypothetical protein